MSMSEDRRLQEEEEERNGKAAFAIYLERLAKQNQLKAGTTSIPCPNAAEGCVLEGQASGWLGAISRLTAQLNRGSFSKGS